MMDTQSICSIRECVLIHIIYSLHLYNEGTYTDIDTIIEEHVSRIGYKPQASISTSDVSPLHLDTGMYTLYYSTIVCERMLTPGVGLGDVPLDACSHMKIRM
jgi:hypothetical protein